MKKNNIKKICMVALAVSLCGAMLTGCGEKKKKIKYGETEGVVSGNVTIDEDGVDIKLDNVIAEAGSDIDYTSGIEVEGNGEYSVDVNASNVKYDTPGTYTATYNFTSGNKTYSEDIKVTIKDDKNKKEEVDSSEMQSNVAGNNTSNQSGNVNSDNQGSNQNETAGNSGNASGSQGGNNTNTTPAGTQSGNNTSTTPAGTQSGGSTSTTPTSNTATSKPNGNQTSGGKETTKKELVTEEGATTYKNANIGNTSIELLSGDVVTINCATNKYIVETKTVESEITKGGRKYKVTKLIVVFNTGKEQTVETIEKRLD